LKVIEVAAGLDDPSAGPSYSVRRLTQGLRAIGLEAEMHSVEGWRATAETALEPAPVRHRQDAPHWPVLGRLCLSSALYEALRGSDAQLIHAHGLWLMPDVYPAWVRRRSTVRFVLSPRGMLGDAALSFSRLPKRIFWRLFQGAAARAADCLHATSASELAEIRAAGLGNPVAVIPNGVSVASDLRPPRSAKDRTLLTLGRIHPKKGLPNLVQAWAALESAFPHWRLRIVGPDEGGHAAELERLAAGLGVRRVTIEPPAFGVAKAQVLQSCDLFVLPTLNENFALTVAEALAAGLPAVVSRGAPWPGVETEGCGWWVEVGVEPLIEGLRTAMSTPDERLRAMGEAGRAWMQRDYSWDQVAQEMAAVYRWLAAGAPPPPCVDLG
jgi:glycosyltransferase involved in cell wall biosynthesis